MSINWKFEVDGQLLRVKATGADENLRDAENYAQAIIEAVLATGKSRLLCDETELVYRLSTIETFKSAEYASRNAPKSGLVAVLCTPEQLNTCKFWETVAVNRGLKVRVFTDKSEAETWLSK